MRLWLAALVLLGATSGVSYVMGRSDGRKVERAAAAKAEADWRADADAAYALYLEARDKKQIEYRTITKTVEVAKHATPDIPDCRTGDDWLRIFRENAAIANGTTVPSGSGSAGRSNTR